MNPNDPALPSAPLNIANARTGLTKREYFASMALSVICWHSALRDARVTPEIIAQEAVGIADALIIELSKEPKDAA